MKKLGNVSRYKATGQGVSIGKRIYGVRHVSAAFNLVPKAFGTQTQSESSAALRVRTPYQHSKARLQSLSNIQYPISSHREASNEKRADQPTGQSTLFLKRQLAPKVLGAASRLIKPTDQAVWNNVACNRRRICSPEVLGKPRRSSWVNCYSLYMTVVVEHV